MVYFEHTQLPNYARRISSCTRERHRIQYVEVFYAGNNHVPIEIFDYIKYHQINVST